MIMFIHWIYTVILGLGFVGTFVTDQTKLCPESSLVVGTGDGGGSWGFEGAGFLGLSALPRHLLPIMLTNKFFLIHNKH